ncbi:hypothetical protein V8F33_006303 [Rhypophila sp. PSN 637]
MDWTFITTPTPVPLPPISGPFGDPNPTKFFNLRTEKDYILASLIPVLLATLLAIPLQLFTKSVNRMMPFRGLTYPSSRNSGKNSRGSSKGGALAQDTLLLSRSPNILTTPAISLRFLCRYHDPLPMFNTLLTVFSLILVPLSAETIMIEFMSEPCTTLEWPVDPFGYAGPCPRGLRKSVLPTRAAEGFLCLIAVLILAMGYLLVRWRTGVEGEPWSLAGLMALLANSSDEVRNSLLEVDQDGRTKDLEKDIEKAVTRRGEKFQLGYLHDVGTYYGIYTVDQKVKALSEDSGGLRLTTKDPPQRRPSGQKSTPAPADEEAGQAPKQNKTSSSATGGSLVTLYRVLALTLITGLLIVILYYENTILDTPFERFMDSQTFGVRFLFAGLGTGISLFWDWYFIHASSQHVFYRLYRPQPIGRPTPVNAQAGNIKTVNAATHDININLLLDLAIPLATLLARFTPILLAGVPFRNTITWKMHEAYTWCVVGVLGYMVIVLRVDGHRDNGISTPPPLPISPNTLAGSMYYVCADPEMLRDFEGLSLVSERDKGRLLLSSLYEVTGSEGADHGQGGDAGREDRRKAKEYVFGELCEEASRLERIGIYTCTVHA